MVFTTADQGVLFLTYLGEIAGICLVIGIVMISAARCTVSCKERKGKKNFLPNKKMDDLQQVIPVEHQDGYV